MNEDDKDTAAKKKEVSERVLDTRQSTAALPQIFLEAVPCKNRSHRCGFKPGRQGLVARPVRVSAPLRAFCAQLAHRRV